jgi:hypothetical protein
MPVRRARIGILTLHYGFNEGAVLQAYSLAKLLRRRMPAADVEIVDQRYPSKVAAGGPADTPRKLALQDAIDHWLPLGKVRTRTNDTSTVKASLRESYNLLVYGSDQVWCLRYRRWLGSILGRGILPTQRAPFFPPYPNVYWPDCKLPMPQVSFAAAVGTLKWNDIPRRHARAMRRGFDACQLIGVRDERTWRFLEWLGGDVARRAVLVPDPTFAEPLRDELSDDVASAMLKSRLVELGVDFSRPRCGIVAGSDPAVQAFADELRRRGVQTIGITTPNDFCDVKLFESGFHPLDWARLFRFVDVCISERMHACIACLLNRTPFVALDINVVPGDADTKLRSLLAAFGLSSYCLSKNTLSASELVRAYDAAAGSPWDWKAIAATVDRFARIQTEFISQMSALVPGQ